MHFRDFPENSSASNLRAYSTGEPTWFKTHLNTAGTTTVARGFRVMVPYFAARYDLGGNSTTVFYRLTATLTDDTGAVVPLQNGGISTSGITMQPLVASSPNTPRVYTGNFTGTYLPLGQLDSANRTYQIKVRIEHIEIHSTETYQDDGETPQTVALRRLLHFNGNLRFGTPNTVFTAYSGSPSAGALGTNLINTSINVTSGPRASPTSPGNTLTNFRRMFPNTTSAAAASPAAMSRPRAPISRMSHSMITTSSSPATNLPFSRMKTRSRGSTGPSPFHFHRTSANSSSA